MSTRLQLNVLDFWYQDRLTLIAEWNITNEMWKNSASDLLLKFQIVVVLGMEPVLPCEKELANKLETTQDIQGFISHVRQLFIKMSGSKEHTAGKKMSKK